MIYISSCNDDKEYEDTGYDYDDLDMDTRCYAISVVSSDNDEE